MFNKTLSNLPLIGGVAENFFTIHGTDYHSDVSFRSTLRALLHNRVGNESVRLIVNRSDYNSNALTSADSSAVFSATVFRENLGENTLVIHDFCADNEESRQCALEKFDKDFVAINPGYRELADMRKFVSPHMDARFYINEESRITIVLVNKMSMSRYHFIQSLIPRYFPWFFKDNPIVDEERSLLASLTNRHAVEYERLIAEIAGKIDLREQIVRSIVGGFEKNARIGQMNQAKRDIANYEMEIRDNLSRYSSLLDRLDSGRIRLAGLQAMLDEPSSESELLEYFLCNRTIMPLSGYDTSLEFLVTCYLDSYDPEMFQVIAKNRNSHMYRGYDVGNDAFRDVESRKQLLSAIFSEEPVLRIKACAYYSLDLRGEVSSARGYTFPDSYRDRLPNPHLHFHNCLGNHRRYICDSLRAGDTIRAIEQCVSSAKSVNVGEGASFVPFLEQLFGTNRSVIELPDGTSATPVEALCWLKRDTQTNNTEGDTANVQTDRTE